MSKAKPPTPPDDDATRKRLHAMGFVDYETKTTVDNIEWNQGQRVLPGAHVVSLPLPQTVSQLRTFARALHFKYLNAADGQNVGSTYILAESGDAPPIGIIDVTTGHDILEKAKLLEDAIPDLPGRPHIDSPGLNSKSYIEVINDAQLQRYLESKYGNITQRRKSRGLKRGPKTRTLEEAIEIVERWVRSGQTQQEFCELQGWKSRTILTDCIGMCRDAFGDNFI